MLTITMIKNTSNGLKTKHIEVRFNLVREQRNKHTLEVEYLPTDQMTSDMLTKPLSPAPFTYLRKKILGMRVLIKPNSLLS